MFYYIFGSTRITAMTHFKRCISKRNPNSRANLSMPMAQQLFEPPAVIKKWFA